MDSGTLITIRKLRADESPVCERMLRALPEWFGIEEALTAYVKEAEVMDTWLALCDGEPAGFLTLRMHNVHAAEIQVMAVLPHLHRRKIGGALVAYAETWLRARSTVYLQVKTLGPSRPNEHYARTRGFYERMGFVPLEENRLWGGTNPCLIMVKHLACAGL